MQNMVRPPADVGARQCQPNPTFTTFLESAHIMPHALSWLLIQNTAFIIEIISDVVIDCVQNIQSIYHWACGSVVERPLCINKMYAEGPDFDHLPVHGFFCSV
jgi:hypothetical protein